MNLKELEALVKAQGEQIEAMKRDNDAAWVMVKGRVAEAHEALSNLTGRIDRVVEGFTAKVDKLANLIGADEEDGPFYPEFKDLRATVEGLREKVEGRNKSAAVKRNMTDADAMRVMNGDASELGHKEAAEMIGLTYAQVYSCRLGFTFKHVHRDLEKAGWKNKWAKG